MNSETSEKTLTVPKGIGLRVETRVIYFHRKLGIEVPLGFEVDGQWRSYQLSDEGLCLSPEELADCLETPDSFGEPLMDDGLAMDAVSETLERCIALVEAAEKQEQAPA